MLEEKLEVALVQIEIYRAIEELGLDKAEKEEWLERVEERLFTISEVRSFFDFYSRNNCQRQELIFFFFCLSFSTFNTFSFIRISLNHYNF